MSLFSIYKFIKYINKMSINLKVRYVFFGGNVPKTWKMSVAGEWCHLGLGGMECVSLIHAPGFCLG